MSKVFSAKRKTVKFEYEFLDGKVESLEVRSLSSKEQADLSNIDTTSTDGVIEKFKSAIAKQLKNNKEKLVAKIIDEQYEEGDLVSFSNSLSKLIFEEKEKK